MRKIAALVLDGSIFFDIGTILTVFAPPAAGSPRPRLPFELTLCSPGGRPVETAQGLTVSTHAGLDALAEADLVIVGGHNPDRVTDAAAAAVRAAHTRTMSICTGAFVLARAGLLDGRPATTHWGYAERLQSEYPAIDVRPDVLYVDDGDVLTSAGLSAGMDLCLHVVRSELGVEAANAVARWNVVPPHREGGQAQYILGPVPAQTGGGLAATRAWALERLDERLTVEDLARHAHMSDRTFARRFVVETGHSPKRWLNAQRIELARRLLETTSLPVEAVARRSGFATAAALRVHFERTTATQPTAYRAAFRAA
jgi:transcriptional regulator GlxA family with amidase domain